MSITYAYQLEVRGKNKVLVPGCEPTSALTSRALSAYMAAGKACKNALVDLNLALAAIPGSYVKYGINFNRGIRQKWYVLPSVSVVCPCESVVNYYDILRKLPGTELPIEETYDKCDIIGMGYCPSPDFVNNDAPAADPYVGEGTFPAGGGVLGPVPPWALNS